MRLVLFLSALLLASCASKSDSKYHADGYGAEIAPDVYKVKAGDTLFAIGWRYGLDPKDIMRKNSIANPNKIFVGQKLYLNSVATASASAIVSNSKTMSHQTSVARIYGNWVWPMKGSLLKRFSAGKVGANGVRISGKPNQKINAAESGIVAYKGNGLTGYGNVVIIKHNNGLLSAYGFLSKTYVKEGQKITKRQRIGTVGYGPNNKLMLHFEVRRNGKPTNPLNYIGSRYHF